jgi:CDP-diacylglycerol--glycerol-3-phosphate 3-phosphatidyltransferase
LLPIGFNVDPAIDVGSSVALASALTLVLGAYVIASVAAGGPLVARRVEREADLPLVGRAPMHAVYRALVPLGRAIAARGVSANTVSVAALVIGGFAAIAFGAGHFGVAALLATLASLADGLDGLIARLTGTKSRFGQILDSTIDRYVDASLLGGLAIHVRLTPVLLGVTLAAIIGSFMVSYASSVERELGVEREAGKPGPMRRAHRLAYLIAGAACAPVVARATRDPDSGLIPVFLAVVAIAIVGNVSAVHRLLAAARTATARDSGPLDALGKPSATLDALGRPSAPASGPDIEAESRVSASGIRR